MKKIKILIFILIILLVSGVMLIAHKPAYIVLIGSMPESVRQVYINYIFARDAFLSNESSKARLLSVLVHRPELLPPESRERLISLIEDYPYDPIGIMSLHIVLELNDKNIICNLTKNPITKEALFAKWDVYKKNSSKSKRELVELSLDECMDVIEAPEQRGQKNLQ